MIFTSTLRTSADPSGIPTVQWINEGNGYYSATYEIEIPRQGEIRYYRLRGTNHPLNTANETDACGNPLPDTLVGANNATKAFADLWFYSNPIFATSNFGVGVGEINNINDIQVCPNPTNSYIYVKGANAKEVKVFNMLGVLVKEQVIVPENKIDIHDLTDGIYTIQIKTDNNIIVNRKIVKQ